MKDRPRDEDSADLLSAKRIVPKRKVWGRDTRGRHVVSAIQPRICGNDDPVMDQTTEADASPINGCHRETSTGSKVVAGGVPRCKRKCKMRKKNPRATPGMALDVRLVYAIPGWLRDQDTSIETAPNAGLGQASSSLSVFQIHIFAWIDNGPWPCSSLLERVVFPT